MSKITEISILILFMVVLGVALEVLSNYFGSDVVMLVSLGFVALWFVRVMK